MISVLKVLHSFDLQMKRTYPELNYNKTLSRTKISSILSCIFVTVLALFQYTIDGIIFPPENISFHNFNGIVTYCTPFIVSNIMVLQFSTLLIVLKQRFEWINTELSRLKQNWNTNSSNPARVFDIESVTKILNLQ